MNPARIVLLGTLEERLRAYLCASPLGHERAAIVLFRRLCRRAKGLADSDRYLAIEVIPFEDPWITSSSSSHISFDLAPLRELFQRCSDEGLVFGFAHNHPGDHPEFSEVDQENEKTLLQAISNRNGKDVCFVALLWANGAWKSRVRNGRAPDDAVAARHLLVLGSSIYMYGHQTSESTDEEFSARQAAAFGKPFTDMLRSLRVAVVGAGGTGSPTISLLVRSGIGEIIVIDKDRLDKSNLNRVRGATVKDVGRNKGEIQKDFVGFLGLPTHIEYVDALLDESPEAVDALATCDVVYGCTDDQIGRETLNTSTYIYAQAFIDVGLGGQVVEGADGLPQLRYHYGRVSTILPEAGECLFCQGVIDPVWIQHQYALRENPKMTEAEAKERYLEGGGAQAPGVGPFTSAIADFGVATLFDLIKPFRKYPEELRRDLYKIDFVKMEIRSPAERNDSNCPYCGMKEYLLVKERYRLNRPRLGKPNASI